MFPLVSIFQCGQVNLHCYGTQAKCLDGVWRLVLSRSPHYFCSHLTCAPLIHNVTVTTAQVNLYPELSLTGNVYLIMWLTDVVGAVQSMDNVALQAEPRSRRRWLMVHKGDENISQRAEKGLSKSDGGCPQTMPHPPPPQCCCSLAVKSLNANLIMIKLIDPIDTQQLIQGSLILLCDMT